MKTFKDNAGRTWTVSITVAAVKRVRDLAGINLMDAAVSGDFLQKLEADPVPLIDALFAVVKPDADRLGVSDTDFGEALAGDAVAAATDAFLEELCNFFPGKKREILTRALRDVGAARERLLALAEKTQQQQDPEAIIRKAESQFLNSVTGSQESSGSTPLT